MASGEAEACTIGSEVDGVLATVAAINGKLAGENRGEAVLESLRQLQAVPMTFQVLEATKIGRAVNALRKNAPSEPARELAATLYRRWKALAEEHFRSSWGQSPASATTDVSEQRKLAPAANPEAPKAATERVRCLLRIKVKPIGSSSGVAAVTKQRSAQLSDVTATPNKAEQPALAARQRVFQRAAAVPKPEPASNSKPSGGSDRKMVPPATTNPGAPEIVTKRVTSLDKAKLLPAAQPPKACKRKEAPTTSIDEERLAMAKGRLQARYKEAADAKEKRRIQFINVPGKETQRRHAPSSLGGARRGTSRQSAP